MNTQPSTSPGGSPIRSESGMLLLRKDGFHLFDIETHLRNRPAWSGMRVPELILWNHKMAYIIEAKKSFSRPKSSKAEEKERKRPDIEVLEKEANKSHYTLISCWEDNWKALIEKYTTALIITRFDILGKFLDANLRKDAKEPGIEREKNLKTATLRHHKIKLVLLINQKYDDACAQLSNKLQDKIATKIRPWCDDVDIICCDVETARKQGFIDATPEESGVPV